MNEEQTQTEGQNNEPTPTDANEGSELSTASYFERADAKLKILEETEKRLDAKIKEYDKIIGRSMMGGKANAGQTPKSKEELQKEMIEAEAKKIAGYF